MKIGTNELLIILLVVILIFGPTQLPKLFNMFGKSIKSMRKGMEESKDEHAGKAEKARPAKDDAEASAAKDEDTSE